MKKTILILLVLMLTAPGKVRAYTQNSWQDLLTGWPTTSPDAIDISNVTGSDDVQIVLIKDNTWWYKTMAGGSWINGTINQDGNTTGYPLPTDKIDAFASFNAGGQPWQIEAVGNRYWNRINKNGEPWSITGILFESDTSSCGQNFPTTIDTISVFPLNGKEAITVTKNGTYWYKPDITTSIYTLCGSVLGGGTGPAKFSGGTDFIWQGKLVQIFVENGRYWFFPAPGNRNLYYSGLINGGSESIDQVYIKQDINSTAGEISKYIFGVNLIWHEPHTVKDLSQIEAKIKELGVTSLRLPGGCGGDSFNWQSTTGQGGGGVGLTLNDYIQIIKNTDIDPLYTFNLESGHVNTNCHNLTDYGGTAQQAKGLVDYLAGKGVNLNYVEVGNEPWAGNSGIPNWTETWEPGEYTNKFNEVKSLLSGYPNIKIIASVPVYDSVWRNQVVESLKNTADGFQAHVYNWGSPEKDNLINQGLNTNIQLQGLIAKINSVGAQNSVAMSEYNLYCWDGVPQPNGLVYPVNQYAQKTGNGFYLADMFKVMIDTGVKIGNVWSLIEQKNSTWECGILKENSAGIYEMTPAAEVFKLFSTNTLKYKLTSLVNEPGLEMVTSKDDLGYAHVALINKSGKSVNVTLDINAKSDKGVRITTLKANSFLDDQFEKTTASVSGFPNQILLEPFSIKSLNSKSLLIPGGLNGDANGDNKVDGVDYVIWLNHYGQTVSGEASVGDFDKSGKVDGVDYVIWLNNYGT